MSSGDNKSRYVVKKKIGGGLQGQIHLIEDTKTNVNYARKLICCQNICELNMSLKEVTANLKLNHIHVVSTHSFYISSTISKTINLDSPQSKQRTYQLFIIYEFCEGKNLMQFIEKHRLEKRKIELSIALRYTNQLLHGLMYIHSQKIIHRDIKPSNLFISKDNILKIGDFGFSKFLESNEQTNSILGSLKYLPPEISKRQSYSYKIDIWGVYVVLFDMLCEKTFDFSYEITKNKEEFLRKNIIHRYFPEDNESNAKEREIFLEFLQTFLELDSEKRKEIDELIRMINEFQEMLRITFTPVEANESSFLFRNFDNELKKKTEATFEGSHSQQDHEDVSSLIEKVKEKDEEIYFLKRELQTRRRQYEVFQQRIWKMDSSDPDIDDYFLTSPSKNNSLSHSSKNEDFVFSQKEIVFEVLYPILKVENVHEVYRGRFRKSGVQVNLIKIPHKCKSLIELKKHLEFHLDLVIRVNHNRIEKHYGFFLFKKEYFVVSEKLTPIDLYSFLKKLNKQKRSMDQHSEQLSMTKKIELCYDIISGVYYLWSIGLCHIAVNSKNFKFTSSTLNDEKKMILKLTSSNGFIRKVDNENFGLSSRKENLLKCLLHVFCEILLETPLKFEKDEELYKKFLPVNEIERKFVSILKICDSCGDVNLKELFFSLGKLKTIRSHNRSPIMPPDIRAGSSFSVYLSPTGVAYSFGWPIFGNGRVHGWLGHVDTEKIRTTPTEIRFFSRKNIKIDKIISSGYSVFFRSTSSKYYCCGHNGYGNLGLSHKKKVLYPTFHPFLNKKNVEKVKLGALFSLFHVQEEEKVILSGCGDNRFLGINVDDGNALSPVPITFFDDKLIDKIRCGYRHYIIMTKNGKLYTTGWNKTGGLCLGEFKNYETSVREITYFSEKGIDIERFSCGGSSSFFVSANGDVYSCGWLNSTENICVPQLITNLMGKKISRVFCGGETVFFVTNDGKKVYGSGKNADGELGMGSKSRGVVVPEEISIKFSSADETILKMRSDLDGWNYGHSFVVTNLGRVYGVGCNCNGQLSFSPSRQFEIVPSLKRLGIAAVMSHVFKKNLWKCTAYQDIKIYLKYI